MKQKSFKIIVKNKILPFKKNIEVDSDKSLSIRGFLIGSICQGVSTVKNVLESEDVKSTISVCKKLGVKIEKINQKSYKIYGKGLGSLFAKRNTELNFSNSGTASRLMIGALSTTPNIKVRLTGDHSLNNQRLDWLRNTPKSSLFTILMVHQPSLWPEAGDFCDLMLSGHTHAGQIAPFHWLVQLQFKFYKGLYQRNQSWLYVSSGSGNWGPQLRIGSTCELVDIHLTSE